VIADARDDRPLGLLNLQLREDQEIANQKAGFQREGTLRAHCKTHGERHDCVMFSLVPAEVPPD
jgi:hypothetical protein